MSLLDRARRATVTGSPPNVPGDVARLWRSAGAGGTAALLSLLVIALPALLAWVASAESTVDWPQALAVGSCAWLLANGAHLYVGPATISLTPWLLSAVPLAVATIFARRILVQLDDRSPHRLKRCGGLRRDVAETGIAFICSYAAVGVVVALVTSREPLHASLSGSALGTAVVGTASVLLALVLELRGRLGSVAPGLTRALTTRLPAHLRLAIRPGLWGALAVFGAGLVLTLGAVVMHLGRIGRLYDILGADPVGMSLLSLGQLLVLPNIAIWAASWLAGPGFGIGEGTAITWSHSNPGLLPLIPGLGALPDPGPMAAGLWLAALVPVAAGVLTGWLCLRQVARLSSWRVKINVAFAACVVGACVLTLASVLAGGSLGAARLGRVGSPSLMFGAVVLVELLLGAAFAVCLSQVRAIRR